MPPVGAQVLQPGLSTRRVRRIHLWSVLVVLIAVGAFGGVGFLVGRSQRIPTSQAAGLRASATSAAFRRAEAGAYAASYRSGYHQGSRRGVAVGEKSGSHAGLAAGRAEVAKRASAAAAAARLGAIASIVSGLARRTPTNKCVQVGGGLCEVLGPGATGHRCPPSSVPNVEGGLVCVPQVVIQAANPAATLAVRTP